MNATRALSAAPAKRRSTRYYQCECGTEWEVYEDWETHYGNTAADCPECNRIGTLIKETLDDSAD